MAFAEIFVTVRFIYPEGIVRMIQLSVLIIPQTVLLLHLLIYPSFNPDLQTDKFLYIKLNPIRCLKHSTVQ